MEFGGVVGSAGGKECKPMCAFWSGTVDVRTSMPPC